jgi:mannose-1-phosphate guanylyltransferase/mannose-6-phosphate isomerase
MIPVILSGGSGTRLWPVSRKSHPKQFWPLLSDRSMLHETCDRLNGYPSMESPIVVCNAEHRFFVADQLSDLDLGKPSIILEPCGRNTAPAVAVAAFHAMGALEEDPVLLILPADHSIADRRSYWRAIDEAETLAEAGYLVTFGIIPTYPETGYGYIEAGGRTDEAPTGMHITKFVEKPDRETAEQYLAAGNFYWNSGMFLFKASNYLRALQELAPEIYQAAQAAYVQARHDLDFIRLDESQFAASPSDSIDYAVMEKIQNGAVVPLDAGWNDVGSWSALWDIGEKDDHGNVVHADALMLDTENCYLHSDGRLLATIGVKDQIIVETPDAALVAHRDHAQRVKDLVARLTAQQRTEATDHHRVHRPWGCYREIDQAERYQVKRITVKPGASLSLQMHHHRAEHWIVVRGTARVTRGEETFLLSENQSTYIPLGERHRLENPGRIPLEMIEVQSGSYLGEDDITRYDDVYGREK